MTEMFRCVGVFSQNPALYDTVYEHMMTNKSASDTSSIFHVQSIFVMSENYSTHNLI